MMNRISTAKRAAALIIALVLTVCALPAVSAADAGPHDHKVESWYTVTAATCTKGGTLAGVCTICGETIYGSSAPLGHDWGEWSVLEPATCMKEGRQEHACTRCGEVEEGVMPIADHNWGKWQLVSEHTEIKPRVERHFCLDCGEEGSRESSPSLKISFASAPALNELSDGDKVRVAFQVENIGEEAACVDAFIPERANGETAGSDTVVNWPAGAYALEPGENFRFSVDVTPVADDADSDSFSRTYSVSGTDINGGRVFSDCVSITVPVRGGSVREISTDYNSPSVYVDRAAFNLPAGSGFAEGDTVVYSVSVSNLGDAYLNGLEIYDSSDPMQPAAMISLAPGETGAALYARKVTKEDALSGFVSGYSYTSVQGISGGGTFCSATTVLPVSSSLPGKGLSIKSSLISEPQGAAWSAGDELEYEITVTNATGSELSNVSVFDTSFAGILSNIETLPDGESRDLRFSSRVTDFDSLNGSSISYASVSAAGPEGEIYSATSEPITLTTVSEAMDCPTVSMEEVSSPANGEYYTSSENVTMRMTVTNSTGRAFPRVEIWNSLRIGAGAAEICSLESGESKSFEFSRVTGTYYTKAGSMTGYAAAAATDESGKTFISQGNAVTVITGGYVAPQKAEPSTGNEDPAADTPAVIKPAKAAKTGLSLSGNLPAVAGVAAIILLLAYLISSKKKNSSSSKSKKKK